MGSHMQCTEIPHLVEVVYWVVRLHVKGSGIVLDSLVKLRNDV